MSDFVPTENELRELRYARERLEFKMRQYDQFSDEYHLTRYNADMGYFWFTPDNKRFFNSRIGAIYHGISPALWNVFVHSEKQDSAYPRLYTVSQLLIDGSIKNLSAVQEFKTSKQANKFALMVVST